MNSEHMPRAQVTLAPLPDLYSRAGGVRSVWLHLPPRAGGVARSAEGGTALEPPSSPRYARDSPRKRGESSQPPT